MSSKKKITVAAKEKHEDYYIVDDDTGDIIDATYGTLNDAKKYVEQYVLNTLSPGKTIVIAKKVSSLEVPDKTIQWNDK